VRLLEAKGITVCFGGVTALSDVSFGVDEGEVLGLIGPNGAGKTTLLNVISGICTPRPGRITYAGSEIAGMRPYRIAKLGIARTFQVVQPFVHLSVRENVGVAGMFSGTGLPNREEALARAQDVLQRVGLAAKADYLPRALTLAERKRLEFARALAMQPRLVRELNRAGLTIIMVEHVMKAIMAACHRIVVLQFGRKIADDSPERVVGNADVIAAYLGDRYARRHGAGRVRAPLQ
jgi:branched-chain amino acid transport system ATP-binding protein